MATTLATLESRVYAILGVDPAKEASGQYGETHVIAALNTAQRFIAKSATPASLGSLAKTAQHTISAYPLDVKVVAFEKDCVAGGRLLFVTVGNFADDVALLSAEEFKNVGKSEDTSSTEVKNYCAFEFGRYVYVRPQPPLNTVFVEWYINDPTDMVAGGSMSLPDDWKEWLALCAAQILALNARDKAKMDDITSLMTGWSAQFRAQYGLNPPTIQAPVESGKVA